jgi:AcrR family transcriptional regulator
VDEPTPAPRAGRRAWEQARQEQTRLALIDAATAVFVRDGYAATTIASITTEAGLSTGSFYNYFPTKEDILRAVVERIHDSFYGGTPSAVDAPPLTPNGRRPPRHHTYDELYSRVDRTIRRFLLNYREHASFLMLLDEVRRVTPGLDETRKTLREKILLNNTNFVERLQEEGLADARLDPFHAASALGAMVDRFAFWWFVAGEPFEEEKAVRTLTLLWLNALGVHPEDPEA